MICLSIRPAGTNFFALFGLIILSLSLINRRGDQKTVEFLLKYSIAHCCEHYVNAPNQFGETPLFFAAQHGDWPELVQFLIEM